MDELDNEIVVRAVVYTLPEHSGLERQLNEGQACRSLYEKGKRS